MSLYRPTPPMPILSSTFPVFSLFLVLFTSFSSTILAHDPPLILKQEYRQNDKPMDCIATTGPVSLSYASYYGQSINNLFHDVALDAAGNIYATGSTIRQGFDAVVVKFDASGNFLWETFLGGTEAENFNGNDIHDYGKIAVDAAGNVYVTGITSSDNFPTASPFQGSRAGGIDAFVTKLDTDGTILLSSYLGGVGDENFGGSGGIAVDSNGDIFVAGSTFSDGFFTSTGAYQTAFSGGTESDAFIVKIAADFSSVQGTYWGDSATDVLRDLKIDPSGNIWAVGYSDQSALTLAGFQGNAIDVRDGIILGFNNSLSTLSGGTFYGGKFDDEINDLAIDAAGNLHITGSTFSTNDFPRLAPFQGSYIGGEEAFTAKLSPACQLIWSTFLAASQNESGSAIALDPSGNVYVSGMTSSINFPVHRSAQETYNTLTCENDAFIFKFNSDGTRDWATYYGGWRMENPYGILANSAGQVITVGRTESTDIAVTDDAYLAEAFTTGVNAFISIFEIACPSTPIIIHSTENAFYYDQFWCNSYTRTTSNYFQSDTCTLELIAPPGYATYSWTKNGSPVSGANDQILAVRSPGSANSQPEYRAIITTGNDCNDASTSAGRKINWVRPMCGFGSSFNEAELPHLANIEEGYDDVWICPAESINFTLNANGFCGAEYQWQKDFEDIPNATDPAFTVSEPGCYRISIINSFTGCEVYSITKKFLLLDQIILNDYYFNQPESCNDQDSITGCSNVFIKARIPNCAGCDQTPRQGITYTFYRNGIEYTSNSYGYVNTSLEGSYTVEASNGQCSVSSTPLIASIRPTEKPILIEPSTSPFCKQDQDSFTFVVQHPAIGDSALLRYDMPYPGTDIITYDSLVRIAKTDLEAGCFDIRLTTKEGCSSRSEDIKIHDTLTPKIQINGSACVPVQLRSENISSCHLDSVFWYLEDSLVLNRNYDASYTATLPGNYVLRVKNACGDFLSDTVFISESLMEPLVSPAGPICLPANLTIAPPDSHIVIHWYRVTNGSYCNQHSNNLIPDQKDTSLIANLAGFYFATLEDTLSGCISSCSNIVEVQRSVAGANITPSNDIYFCDGTGISNVTFSVSPASPSFTYQWYRNNNPIAGATTSSYTTNNEGVYRVFLENACDNAFTPVVSIFSVDNPEVTINQPDTIYLCGPDTIRLDTNNDQPLIYQWYQNDTMVSDAIDSFFLAIEPGKYQVFGINNNTQCEDWSQEIYLLNSTPIIATVTMTPACNGPCTGTLSAMVSGGIPFLSGDYLYAWDSGASNSDLTNVCEGNYRLTITDAIACSTVLSGHLDAGFTLNPSIDSIACSSSIDGNITVLTSGGQAPFSFHWNTGDSTNQLSNIGPGNYSLTVTDDQNCSTTYAYNLSAPSAISIQLTPSDALCQESSDGSIGALISGGTPPYQMTWDSLVILDSMMLYAGDYHLTITDKNGCNATANTSIDAPSKLTSQLTISNTLDCSNSSDGSILATGSGGKPPYTFLWEDHSSNPSRTGLSAGTYYLTLIDDNQCQSTDQITLDPKAQLSFGIIDSTDLSCWEANDGAFTFQVTGGTAPYTYFVNNLPTNDSIITSLAEGSYSLYVEDSNNCGTLLQNISLDSPDSLSALIQLTPTTCPGVANGIAELIVSGGTPGYQYDWSNGFDQSLNDTLRLGSYSVTISDANACSKIVSFEIEEPLPLSTSFSLVDNSCHGDTTGAVLINSTSGGTPPYTYFLDSSNIPVTSTQNLFNLKAGNYILRTLDANNCEQSESIIISEPELLTLDLSVSQEVTCFSGSDGILQSLVAGGTGPYTYLWENGNATDQLTNITSGFYQLTVTDANDCSAFDTITLEEGPFIELTIIDQKDVDCFGAANGYFVLNGIGGTAPYRYFVNTQESLQERIENLPPGTYTVYTEDANGCISENQSITIEQPELLQASVNTKAVQCFGEFNGTANISVHGGTGNYQYLWNNQLEVEQANDLAAGNYLVTITDDNACTTTLNFTISSPEFLETNLNAIDNLCFDDQSGSISLASSTGGTSPYHYFYDHQIWLNPNEAISNLSAGSYQILTVDAEGCEYLQEIVIEEPPLFSLDLGEDRFIPFGQNARLDLSINNGRGIPIMEISPKEFIDCPEPVSLADCPNPEVILPTRNMHYTVKLTDENGCVASDDFQLFLDRSENGIYMPNIFHPAGAGFNRVFYVQSNATIAQVDQFIILNRWGAMVFEANSFLPNDETFGWDGRVNGTAASEGVYVWMVVYRTIDGELGQLSGDVILGW